MNNIIFNKISAYIKPSLEHIIFYHYSHGIRVLSAEFNHSVNWFHTTPNVHIISYLIGICFGFMFNKKDLKISDKLVRIFWFLSFAAIFLIYYWNDTFWKVGPQEPELSVLLWHTIGKVFFSSSYGWIFYACCTGKGGIRPLSHHLSVITRERNRSGWTRKWGN